VIKGRASVEQKTITGESLPVDRQVGSKVYAATVVREGKLYLRAERVGRETTAAQIVRMVSDAPIGETRIQNYAEKFADRLVAPSLAVATGLCAVSGDVNRFLSMVIIDYGTGIRVAAPTSVLASMIHAARHGIMIKGGSQIEKLNRVDTILFDKTGTLTEGRPHVQSIRSYDERHFPSEKILALAAAAEARLTHPVAEAVLAKARELKVKIPPRSDSRFHVGLGVEVHVNGHTVHLGSERFLRDQNIRLDSAIGDLRQINSYGHSALLLAVEGKIAGAISYADQIRPECSAVIKTLHNRGLRDLTMLTGDNSTVAAGVASRLGLDRFVANVFPAEKAEIVAELQREGRVVAMVGDGINDSPALARADVGIAMKGGADIAREAADVVLMEENLWKLIAAFDVSSDAMKLIRQNFAIIAGLNTLAYALAIPPGLINPGITTLISNGSAILATLNAVRPVMKDSFGPGEPLLI
jgi:heavy metal translocating P-type ATPase